MIGHTSTSSLKKENVILAINCVIIGFYDNELQFLITRRQTDPLKGGWSLPEGFVFQNESIQQTTQRIVSEYTGIDQPFIGQISVYDEVKRSAQERTIAIAHYALVNIHNFDPSVLMKHDTRWIKYSNLPKLIFDHSLMIKDGLEIIQRQARETCIALNLLSELFTLPTLQSVYESIYQKSIDKRNFRKKLSEMEFIKKSDTKNKQNSKKGAYYYTLDKEVYNRFILSGGTFSL